MTQELIRRIDNVVQIGKICEIKSHEGKALARVEINGRVTDFLPVFLWSSDFLKVWLPIRLGQQVSVLHPFGDGNFGIILPGIYHKNNKEPEGANEKNIIFEIRYKEYFIRVRIEDSDIFMELKKGEHTLDFRLENLDIFFKMFKNDDNLTLKIENMNVFLDILKNGQKTAISYADSSMALDVAQDVSIKAKNLSIQADNIRLDGEVETSKNLRVAQSVCDELGDLTHHGHPR
ncbi:MAG: hypothetical protein GXO16_03645 [Epsilonproteobacteria bacterium]|nr:hypothetical protein [Campylobacterota bacterium]